MCRSKRKKGGTRSCGCLAKNFFKKRNDLGIIQEDLSGVTINNIKLLNKTSFKDNNRSWYYQCKCPYCPEQFLASIRKIKDGGVKSCGCLGNTSSNELAIKDILNENQIIYKYQHKFLDCKNIYSLPFDFYINNKYILEFDGLQHFLIVDFFGGKEGFISRRKNDLIKNKYCFENNIPLIRIPYDADYTIDDLKLETTRFLLTPENEKEYYERII